MISDKFGKELKSCSGCLVGNKMSLHLGKTECILFGSKRKLRKIKEFSVSCNEQTITAQNSVKYLRINVDQFLSSGIMFLTLGLLP